jgi:hypothetical protein
MEAKVCYAYLFDVADGKVKGDPIPTSYPKPRVLKGKWTLGGFSESHWFERGWTLQELLAPKELRFFDHAWTPIGTKASRAAEIQKVTRIQPEYLNHGQDLSTASVARKISWAANRSTSIPDDMAYCLLGILGLSMDVRYGEGQAAFLRLGQKLVEETSVESLFAWTHPDKTVETSGLLAAFPEFFQHVGDFTNDNKKKYKPRIPYGWANGGVEFHVPDPVAEVWLYSGNQQLNNLIPTLRRNLRKNYELALNCWKFRAAGGKDTVAIKLQKQDGKWRRVSPSEVYLKGGLRSSKSFMGLKTLLIHMPQRVVRER